MPAQGLTTALDFTATPSEIATIDIAEAGILTTSYVEPWVMDGDSTADNTVDEHDTFIEQFILKAYSPIDGTLRLTASSRDGLLATGTFKVRYAWN